MTDKISTGGLTPAGIYWKAGDECLRVAREFRAETTQALDFDAISALNALAGEFEQCGRELQEGRTAPQVVSTCRGFLGLVEPRKVTREGFTSSFSQARKPPGRRPVPPT